MKVACLEKATNSTSAEGILGQIGLMCERRLYRAVAVQLSSIRLTFPTRSIGMLIALTDLQLRTVPFVTGILRENYSEIEGDVRERRFFEPIASFSSLELEWKDGEERYTRRVP